MFGISRMELNRALSGIKIEIEKLSNYVSELHRDVSRLEALVDDLWAKEFEPWREGLEREGYGPDEIDAVRVLHRMERMSPSPAPVMTVWSKMYPDVAAKYLDLKREGTESEDG